ncbi:AAA family ATPase [Brevibacillus centrosporus]|uniref:AAA family ATPase n=1 Tax=Brevibacillus centrosporus TaxID=54910 RepID=UPI003B027C43
MKKVFLIGSVASGKTTLAKRLSKKMNVPWFELDSIVHHQTPKGRCRRTPDEQLEVIMEIDKKGAWILEGTDRDSYQYLYKMADTIIFLDTPLRVRKIRILLRFLKQILGMEKCAYKPDLVMVKMMYKWTRDFEQNRGSLEAKLEQYKKKVTRLKDIHRHPKRKSGCFPESVNSEVIY